jgi:CDP-ribitol ribitolphosphotransferase
MNESIINSTIDSLKEVCSLSNEQMEATRQLLQTITTYDGSDTMRETMISYLQTLVNMDENTKNYNTILNRICIKNLIPAIYSMNKEFPVENKYLFMQPRKGLNQSCRYIYKKMEREYDCNLYLHELHRDDVSKIEYFVNAMLFIKDLATAKAVFVHESNNLLGYVDIRPETKVVQLWHGCGVLKKLGLSTIGKKGFKSEEGHIEFPEYNKYSIVTIASPELSWVFEEFMGIKKESGIIQPIGVSRTDEFFDENYIDKCYQKLYKAIPEAKNKKIILYAPTYRGLDPNRVSPNELDIAKFAKELGDEYLLIFKHHQTAKNLPEIPEEYRDKFAYDMTRGRGLNINELMTVSDICITDYSSVAFEFSLFERPLLFYVFDLEEYIDDRGLYYDFNEVTPGPLCKTNDEMIDYIKNLDVRFDKQEILDFKQKFMCSCDGHATERILDYVGVKKKPIQCKVYYFGKNAEKETYSSFIESKQLNGQMTTTPSGQLEFRDSNCYYSNVPYQLVDNHFKRTNYAFSGWYLRKTVNSQQYWYCTDNIWRTSADLKNSSAKRWLFKNNDSLEKICDLKSKNVLVLEAQWSSVKYKIYYLGKEATKELYSASIRSKQLSGKLATTPSGNFEFRDSTVYSGKKFCRLQKNLFKKKNHTFIGWHLRRTIHKKQYWYCKDGTWKTGTNLASEKYLFKEYDSLKNLPDLEKDNVLVLETQWVAKKSFFQLIKDKLHK